MEARLIELFFEKNGNKLPEDKHAEIRSILESADEDLTVSIAAVKYFNPSTMVFVSWWAGAVGIDRDTLGQWGLGILKFITFGGLGIWWLIDLINIRNITCNQNYKHFMKAYKKDLKVKAKHKAKEDAALAK